VVSPPDSSLRLHFNGEHELTAIVLPMTGELGGHYPLIIPTLISQGSGDYSDVFPSHAKCVLGAGGICVVEYR
jgi:hypothetical protein